MKLNFGRRMVLFVHWLLSLAACAMAVALIIWPECRQMATSFADNLTVLIYAIAVLVVYLLFSVGAVSIIWSGRKNSGDHGFIVVDSSETGRTRIAVVAVEQMIRQAVRGVDGIAQMKAAITNGEDSISIDVDVTILNGVHVPTVTMNIQRAIRSYIELNCGVAVRGVSVSVHSLTEAEQPGRRGRRKSAAVSVEPVTRYEAPANVQIPEAPAPTAIEPEQPAWSEPEPVSAPAEEPVAEQQTEAAPEEAPAPKKKGFFKGLFGKRGAATAEEPVEPETVEREAEAQGEADAEPVAGEPEAIEEPETMEAEDEILDEFAEPEDEE